MKFPSTHAPGAPHQPVATLTGHFTGMHPIEGVGHPADLWYRGDDYAARVEERDRYREGLGEIIALFDKPDVEILDFLEVAERYLK
jgi:hypothetical protein